jgi:putative two-component system response regulator
MLIMHFIDRTLIRNSVILAVDDSPVLLDALDISIGELCKEFLVATNAEQAVSLVTEKMPDLILMDVDMPNTDGFELFEQLKALTIVARIPVIFLTSMEDKRVEARALEMGAVDYITKPFDRTVLLHRLNTHLNISYYCSNLENSLQSIENELISTFATLLESRDAYAHGHSIRTSLYMGILGREVLSSGFNKELNEGLLRRMQRAAPLHDIGKVGISDSVLLKPEIYSKEDFEVMKTHTIRGAAVLGGLYKKMPNQYYLYFAEQMALNHHERYNGSGYPNGIAGEQIPFSARLMAIPDVYDAMTHDRVYRKAMSHKEACKIILSGSGRQFDPAIIEAFDKVKDEFRDSMESTDLGEMVCA